MAKAGQRLRTWREDAGLSQRDVAARLGIEQSTLCRIEQGRNQPGLQIAIRIEKLSKLPVAIWFTPKTPHPRAA